MIPNRTQKIGRNDLCPCGSMKKYKRCHGGINEVRSPTPGQIDAQLKKLSPKAACLAPPALHCDCQGKVIDSHTVSRSGSLGAIIRDGHVYSYAFTLQHIDRMGGKLIPKLTGWKDASTFPGFCAHHDKQMFAPLEDVPFTGSEQQCFLLGYRSIAWEVYAKRRAVTNGDYRSVLSGAKGAMAKAAMDAFNHMTQLGLRDAEAHKAKYDAVLEAERWTDCHGLLIEFTKTFPIQCAAAWSPTNDINGDELQDLGTTPRTPATATIGSFAANGKSYFLLSWLKDSSVVASKIADSIVALPCNKVAGVIAALLVQTSENCHFAPGWYDSLSDAGKRWLEAQGNPFIPTPPPSKMAISAYFPDIGVARTHRF